MPIKKEREYRALAAPLTAQSATKLIQTEYYVEGYPWNVNTNIGARGACDLVRTLQAQSSTEYWQGLRKG